MALTVNTNIASMNALNNLNGTQRNLSKTLGRVSSGLRVNSAADDAAGLGTAENLDAAQRSLRVAMRNTSDGISVVQTAEGATEEVANIIKRMRDLAVQSASETLATTERGYIVDEFDALETEISRIAAVSDFNGVQLTDGSQTSLDVQVGIDGTGNDRIQIDLGDLRATSLGITAVSLSTAAGAQSGLARLDSALNSVNGFRSDFGAVQNRLESAMRNLETYTQNLAQAESNIRDADFAYEAAELSKYQIMQQAGVAVLGQANAISQGALRLIG